MESEQKRMDHVKEVGVKFYFKFAPYKVNGILLEAADKRLQIILVQWICIRVMVSSSRI